LGFGEDDVLALPPQPGSNSNDKNRTAQTLYVATRRILCRKQFFMISNLQIRIFGKVHSYRSLNRRSGNGLGIMLANPLPA